jgi:hypothetical protein
MHGRGRTAFGVGTVRRVFIHQSADQDVPIVVLQLLTESHACFSAKSAAQHVCVFPLERLETKKYALATITGRLNKAAPSALDFNPALQISALSVK